MECFVCLKDFNNCEKKLFYLKKCGHVLCKNCILNLEKPFTCKCLEEFKQVQANPDLFLKRYNNSTISLLGHTSDIQSITPLSDSQIVSGDRDHILKIWNSNTGELIQSYLTDSFDFTGLDVLPNNVLVSSSTDETLKLFDLNNGSLKATLTGHTRSINCVKVISNDLIISGSDDSTIKLWSPNNKGFLKNLCHSYKELFFKAFNYHDNKVKAIEKLSDSVIISGSNNVIKLWDFHNEKVIREIKNQNQVRSLAVLSNNKIVSGHNDNKISIWDAFSGNLISSIKGQYRNIDSVIALSNGKIVSVDDNEKIKLWDSTFASPTIYLEGHSNRINDLKMLSDNKIASCSNDKTIKIWQL